MEKVVPSTAMMGMGTPNPAAIVQRLPALIEAASELHPLVPQVSVPLTAVTLLDAVLCLALAARIHGTDAAVKTTAKRLCKRLPGPQRAVVRLVTESRRPLLVVEKLLRDEF